MYVLVMSFLIKKKFNLKLNDIEIEKHLIHVD
jgi:hypothetical protein